MSLIPKKLHYCWFGSKPKSETFQNCFESWKKFCPDFEIIEWNECNSEKFANTFYRNALRKKKYAFVADYIRSKVLLTEGGVYLDTDMMLLKPIDQLLQYDFFIGEEIKYRVNFAIFGARSGQRFVSQMVEFYDGAEFNEFSPPVITHTFSSLINKTSLKLGEIIFSPDVFYPLPYQFRLQDYSTFVKSDTLAVHLWDHSWAEPQQESILSLIKKVKIVFVDFVCYGYSYSYFRRYSKEFLRKLYHKLKT